MEGPHSHDGSFGHQYHLEIPRLRWNHQGCDFPTSQLDCQLPGPAPQGHQASNRYLNSEGGHPAIRNGEICHSEGLLVGHKHLNIQLYQGERSSFCPQANMGDAQLLGDHALLGGTTGQAGCPQEASEGWRNQIEGRCSCAEEKGLRNPGHVEKWARWDGTSQVGETPALLLWIGYGILCFWTNGVVDSFL